LEGVTFDDGGNANGTFSTDSSTGDIVSYDITTTTGTAVLGAVYARVMPPLSRTTYPGRIHSA
jgi:hypothetical protein